MFTDLYLLQEELSGDLVRELFFFCSDAGVCVHVNASRGKKDTDEGSTVNRDGAAKLSLQNFADVFFAFFFHSHSSLNFTVYTSTV